MKNIIVLFKTHLDVGFTDFSANVVRDYNEKYIPRAIEVGRELAERGCFEGFVWTTGSWLIHQYLKQADEDGRRTMEEAIRQGWIRWHALPFTMHSELAGKALYEYALSISRKLDFRFGVTTIAAKNTDVPGHTIGIVPLLANTGVELLHIGVNPASKAPDVPDLFRWVSADGSELVVMYSKGDYGDFARIPGTDTYIYFAHTGDNHGPQSAEDILSIYDEIRSEHPNAQIRAGTLNDIALAVRPIRETLPVITQELGDTWIHGAGTDPQKLSAFRSLLRYAAGCPEDVAAKIYEELLLIPEHTWGLDEKSHLKENVNYRRDLFDKARSHDNYRKMEASWQEQRDYIIRAVDALGEPYKSGAQAAVSENKKQYPDVGHMVAVSDRCIEANGWTIALDDNGVIVGLNKDSKVYADSTHPLCGFLYEAFSEDDVNAFTDRYLKSRPDWALDDFGKVGLANEIKKYKSFTLECDGIYRDGNIFHILYAAPSELPFLYGCPPKLVLTLEPLSECLRLDFAWFDKSANRSPESLWLSFKFVRPLTSIKKLGSDINPTDVVSDGNRELHAVDGTIRFGNISLETLDAPLIAVGKPAVYAFHNEIPNTAEGVWINLFNNQWGTNFPMWNEGDARFRFVII